jgi:DNA-binding NarL/FixJ family response regulator
LPLDSPLNPKSVIRIVIAEDFVAFRRLMCSILQKRQNLQVICEVSTGLEAVQKAEELKPDLILFDIGLPKMNGFRRLEKFESARQNPK